MIKGDLDLQIALAPSSLTRYYGSLGTLHEDFLL